jgi:O-antigen ligase
LAANDSPVALGLSVGALERANRDRTLLVGLGFVVAAALTGILVGELTLSGHIFGIAVLLWILVPIITWRWPAAGVAMLVVLALSFEEYPSIAGLKTVTESVPIFKSLAVGAGLSGLVVNPAELIIATVALTWIAKAAAQGTLNVPRSHLAAGIGLVVVAVVAAELHGLASGGNLTASLWELRPWAYLACLYLLAAQLFVSRSHLQALLWTLVIASGVKGGEGAARYLLALRGANPPAANVLAHEEAVFLGIFILLAGALWLFGIKGRLRQVATALLPIVVFADLVNNRRTAYVILGAGLAILLAVAWVRSPLRRWMVGGIAVALLAVTALYLPVFWNRSGVLAEPASAIRSAVDPNQRDAASDLYRVIENIDLGIDIHATTPFGLGFGKPIPTTIALPNLSNIDAFIAYEPHNTILYLWLRLGILGAVAFWWMVAAAVIAACRVARFADRSIAIVGILALLVLAAYLIEGWYDQGLVSLRVAIVTGAALGALEAAQVLIRAPRRR